ncbi:MAG: LacI family DNA-binding transcriptional regulator [Trueperaceae bacterium]
MKRPSVREVAKLAGVGTSTVSRALNNHPSVSDYARRRVLTAAEELGYTPNLTARRLRTGQTHAISVLLPMTGPEFYTRLLDRLESVLERESLDIALFPVVGGIRLKRYRDAGALPYHADGLIIASLDPDRIYQGRRPPYDRPIVLVDAHHPDFHSVYFENAAAGRLAAEHALSLGAPIALVDVEETPGAFESPAFRERRQGIMHELQRHGIGLVDHIRLPISIEEGRRAAQLLPEPGSGESLTVIATCDELALGVLRQLGENGQSLGRDVSVIGFDDQSAAGPNELTTVAQPIEEMGAAAAELLVAALAGGLERIEQVAFPPRLVIRRSTVGRA